MKVQTVEKTDKLSSAKFRKNTQRYEVWKAISALPSPARAEDIVERVKKAGYESLLGDWAKQHGGVPSSVSYHLRGLRDSGMLNINTHSEAVTPTEAAVEIRESIETTFGLERDLQNALRDNISQLQAGLKVTDGGKERNVPSGRVDILASASDGTYVVIELKAGIADRDAVGQILSYIGDLHKEAKGKVRGILVAGDFTDRAIAASTAAPNV